MNEAIEAAEAGKFQHLIVRSHTRFSRDATGGALLQEQFENAGVTLHWVNLGGPVDPTSSAGIWTEGIMRLKAEAERADIRDRIMRGKYQAAREGKIVMSWITPYGYQKVRHDAGTKEARTSLEIEPTEAAVIEQIFKDFIKDPNCSAIARDLNEREVPKHEPFQGTDWDAKFISRIIANETYKGQWYYGRHKSRTYRIGMEDKTERWVVDKSDPSVIPVTVPAIVSEAVFDEAQVKAETIAKQARGNIKAFYLLRRIVTCAECGLKYWGIKAHGGKNGYYIHSRTRRECSLGGLRFEQYQFESEVIDALIDMLSTTDDYWQKLAQEQEASAPNVAGRLSKIATERAKLERRLVGYQEMRADGEITKQEYADRVSEAQDRDQALADAQEQLIEKNEYAPIYFTKAPDDWIKLPRSEAIRWDLINQTDEQWSETITRRNVRIEVRSLTERDIYADRSGVEIRDDDSGVRSNPLLVL